MTLDTTFSEGSIDAIRVPPGEYHAGHNNEIYSTVIASCICVCMRDPVSGAGGINHFILPSHGDDDYVDKEMPGRYGIHAMRLLIDSVIRNGGKRENLECKVFGGAHIIEGHHALHVGQINVQFITEYMAREGLRVVSQDVGGAFPRKLYYFLESGVVKLRRFSLTSEDSPVSREQRFIQTLDGSAVKR